MIYIERDDGKLSDELFIPLKVAGLVYAAVYLGVLLSSEVEIAKMALIPSGQMGIWHKKRARSDRVLCRNGNDMKDPSSFAEVALFYCLPVCLLYVFEQFHGIDILLYSQCHILSRFHGKNHRLWPVYNIASSEYTTSCCHA